MEKQLESLTELVKELTNPRKSQIITDFYNKSFHQQLYELKVKTHTLRNDLLSIRRMQQSLQENFQIELEEANKKNSSNLFLELIKTNSVYHHFLKDRFIRSNQSEKVHFLERDFHSYVQNRTKIDQDLEYKYHPII